MFTKNIVLIVVADTKLGRTGWPDIPEESLTESPLFINPRPFKRKFRSVASSKYVKGNTSALVDRRYIENI